MHKRLKIFIVVIIQIKNNKDLVQHNNKSNKKNYLKNNLINIFIKKNLVYKIVRHTGLTPTNNNQIINCLKLIIIVFNSSNNKIIIMNNNKHKQIFLEIQIKFQVKFNMVNKIKNINSSKIINNKINNNIINQ